MEKIQEALKQFVQERNWEKFHTGVNLAKSISIEANELLELFQWNDETTNQKDLKRELADVFIYAIMLSMKYNLDVKEIINDKIKENREKYPVEKSYGSSKKYNKLD